MTDELAPYFETRELRVNRLPDEARSNFQLAANAAREAGQVDFEDRQFVSLWLSRRVGMPRADILNNFDAIAGRFFGEGATATKAWDAIAATYKQAGAGGGDGQGGGENARPGQAGGQKDEEFADTEGLAKVGRGVLLENVEQSGRAAAAGFTGFAQQVPAGLYSQAATVMASPGRPKSPFEDRTYLDLAREKAQILRPPFWPYDHDKEPNEREKKRLAKIDADMAVLAKRTDEANLTRLKEFATSDSKAVSEEYRRLAGFWYDLSKGASERMGVNPDFEKTTLGGFMKSAGSVPATAALAVMGPAGWVGMESSFFGQVEQERMEKEGAAYDPEKAAAANLASAVPQAILERAFGAERLMNKVLGELPKMQGKVTFGDFARMFVRNGLTAGAEEAITEPTQNFWNDYIASITYDQSRELFTADAAKQRLVESVSAFALGFLFGGGVTSLEAVDQNRKVSAGERYLTTKDGQTLTEHDFTVLRGVKSDRELMATAPDEETGRMLVAAASGNKEAQAAYNNRVMASLFVKTEEVDVGGMSVGTVNDVPVIRDADGVIIPLDLTQEADRAFLDNFKREAVKVKATQDTLAEMQARHGDTLEASQPAKLASLEERVASGQMTQEQADDALEVAKTINGLAADLKLSDVAPEGTATTRQDGDVFKMVVEVAQSADPTKAIEEVSEAYIQRAYRTRDLVPADLNDARLRWHEQNGEADAAAGMDGEKLDRANIEWFSKRVVEYAVANRKTELPGGWGAWLRTLGEQLKKFLGGVTRMKKLMRDGKLDQELEAWMKGAIGKPGDAFVITSDKANARAEQGNIEAAPVASEVDQEMMDTALADQAFPKIEKNDSGNDFLVSAPGGRFLGSRTSIEDAQQLAVEWFDRNAREEEQAAAKQDAGETKANELMTVILKHGLPAPSVEPTFAGELRAIRENMGTAKALRIFRKKAGELDMIRQAVNEEGFAFETVTDFLDALDRSSRGEPIYGNQGGNEQVTFALTGVPQNSAQALQAQASALRAKKLAATAQLTARLRSGTPLPKRAALVRRTTQASLAARLAMPISSRLARINRSLAQRLRRFEFDLGNAITRDFAQVEEFIRGFEKMRPDDAAILDLALKNGDTATRDTMLAAYNLTAAFEKVQAVLEATKAKAKAAGYDFGEVADYFPRKVNDVDGLFMHYYGKPQAGRIEEVLREAQAKAAAQGRTLTHEERVEIVNSVLRGFRPPEAKPSNLKARKTDVVDLDADRFYADSVQALVSYIESLNSAIEQRRFFGKYHVTMQSATGGVYSSNRIAVEASIGALVEDMIAAGTITRAQQAEVSAVLAARFQQQASSPFIRAFKALSYMGTMGQITSAMTQLTDLAFSMYENGIYDTMIAAGQAVTRTSKISRKDLSLDTMAEEFREMGALHKALNRVFKLVGIHYLDMVGKETLVNAKFRAMQREAAAGKLSVKSRALISASFGPTIAPRVIGELARGQKTEDTMFAVYSVLADYQPVSMSEMPEFYLRHPNGRVFYMLKTFALKQIDSFRRESLTLIVHGNAKQKAVGFRNLIHMAALLYMIGLPVDWLKDWVMGRDPQMGDLAVDNLWKLLGVNRWNVWQFRERKNPLEAAMLLVVPPAPFLQYPLLDAEKAAKQIAAGDEIEPGNFESWRMLPFVGAPLYWWFGGGAQKVEKRKRERERGRVNP